MLKKNEFKPKYKYEEMHKEWRVFSLNFKHEIMRPDIVDISYIMDSERFGGILIRIIVGGKTIYKEHPFIEKDEAQVAYYCKGIYEHLMQQCFCFYCLIAAIPSKMPFISDQPYFHCVNCRRNNCHNPWSHGENIYDEDADTTCSLDIDFNCDCDDSKAIYCCTLCDEFDEECYWCVRYARVNWFKDDHVKEK